MRKASNGLTVPEGYGKGGSFKGASRPASGRARSAPRRTRRAEDVTEGMRLRGRQTLDTYEVLHVGVSEDQKVITLTVLNQRTQDVRHWSRRASFPLEMA